MDLKQRTILNGLVMDGHIHSWAIVYDSVDDYWNDRDRQDWYVEGPNGERVTVAELLDRES